MFSSPLESLAAYSAFVAETLQRATVLNSTVVVWSDGKFTGVAEGEVRFTNDFRLRMQEELDFGREKITTYGYEVYRNEELLYRYDDFPHPNDVALASTFPHHKHIPPNIGRNRIPAPELSFTKPNLPFIIEEIERHF